MMESARCTKPFRLPLELCAHVFDCLEGDCSSLRACTLVCHSWLHLSRLELFRLVRLDLDRLRDQSRITELVEGSTVHCSYIRTLQIGITSLQLTGRPLTYDDCRRILQNCTRLRTLSFDQDSVCSLISEPAAPLLSVGKLVLWLSEYSSSFSNRYIQGPLKLFSSINHLVIDAEDDSIPESPDDDSQLTHFKSFKHLIISALSLFVGPGCMLVLRRLLKSILPTLTALHIHYCPFRALHATGMLINDAAPRLRTLTLNLCYLFGEESQEICKSVLLTLSYRLQLSFSLADQDQAYWSILHLQECHALETLRLVIDRRPWRAKFASAALVDLFCSILLNAPTTIRTLIFQVNPMSTRPSTFDLDFGRMETAIIRIASLDMLGLEIVYQSSRYDHDEWRILFSEKLPRLQHLLRFDLIK